MDPESFIRPFLLTLITFFSEEREREREREREDTDKTLSHLNGRHYFLYRYVEQYNNIYTFFYTIHKVIVSILVEDSTNKNRHIHAYYKLAYGY